MLSSNLEAYIKKELHKLGCSYQEEIDLHGNFLALSNRLRRVPVQMKRKVIEASTFKCPQAYVADYQSFILRSEAGDSLLALCSRKNSNKSLAVRDPLFDDWGIIHFHFKESGTKEVMFGVVTSDTIYLLAVYAHGKGHGDVWYKKELIETIHREFPFLIEHLKLSKDEKLSTELDHRHARKHSYNRPIVLSDGSSYYPIGGGIMTNKTSMHDVRSWMVLSRKIESYEMYVRGNIGKIAYGHGVQSTDIEFALSYCFNPATEFFEVKCKSNYGVEISL
ncbi:hypothetical protein [Vibrio fluvialis]|uniref:hypothetical protein n=1 Tax=Vibrio fluvialis TaxID=676 RepID=UPI002B259D9B|nr:hypothetical protein [Vibrio fluvialis]WPK55459.1 hypothetical protein NAF16_17395 [Vibrio fluvialis]